MAQIDIDHLQSWIGTQHVKHDELTRFPADALAATLDRDDAPYDVGAPLPPLWHWLYFLDVFKLEDAGYDGHAALGHFLPPIPLPRRMWAGSRLRFLQPLTIGETASKTSKIVSVSHKTGRSGDLVFVTVSHTLSGDAGCCIEEEHDIVYRAAPSSYAPGRPAPQVTHRTDVSRSITPSEPLLFRYSALTFNGHRIHYDHPFCVTSEGYDGLVVHGPLLATLMLDLIRRSYPAQRVQYFEFRAQAPVTGMVPFEVQAGSTETRNVHRVWIRRADGAEAMSGKVELSP